MGGRFASPSVSSAHPAHPLRWRGGLGFQDEKRRRRTLLGECRGCVGAALAGRVGVRGGRVGWCALSSVGHRRQSGTCREVKRRAFPLVRGVCLRRLTSRQNPDRASPARPRREHTPRGSVWAALCPGPGGLGGLRSRFLHRPPIRPPRFSSSVEECPVARPRPMKNLSSPVCDRLCSTPWFGSPTGVSWPGRRR